MTRVLAADQWTRCRLWFENARRARELLAELASLSLQQFASDPCGVRKDSRDVRRER